MIFEQKVQVVYDAGAAGAAVEKFTRAIGQQNKAFDNIEEAINSFNEALKRQTGSLTATADTITQKMDKMGNVVRVTVSGMINNIDRLTQTFEKSEENFNVLTGTSINFGDRQKAADNIIDAMLKANDRRKVENEKALAEETRIREKAYKEYKADLAKKERDLQEFYRFRRIEQEKADKLLNKQIEDKKNFTRAALTTSGFRADNFGKIDFSQVDPRRIASLNAALESLRQKLVQHNVPLDRVNFLYRNLQQGFITASNASEAKLIPALARVASVTKTLADSTNKYTRGMSLSWQSLARLTAIQYLHRVIASINQLFQDGVRYAFDYANKIALIRTLTLNNSEAQDKWSKSIYKTANIYGADLLDTADAYYEAVSNQIATTTQDTENFINVSLKLARVSQSTAKDAGQAIAGVLNAYNLNAAQATEVAAVLFKTMDLGSLTIGEVADKLGRAATLAKTLNIPFEELAAAIATLTIESRKADYAITALRALETKLAKPTKDMTALFQELGYETPQLAVAILGLPKVLEVLHNELQSKGLSVLAKYGNEIRSLEAFASLAGTGFEKFNNAVNEMKTAVVTFNAAFQETQQPLKLLQIELAKLRNYFIKDVGTAVAKFLQELNVKAGGFATLIRDIVSVISTGFGATIPGTLAKGLASFLGVRNVIVSIISVLETAATSFLAFKITMGLVNSSMRTFVNWGLLAKETMVDWSAKIARWSTGFLLGLDAVILAVSYFRQQYLATFNIAQDELDKFTAKFQALDDTITANAEIFNKVQRDRLSKTENAITNYVTGLVKAYEKEQDAALENVHDVEQFIEAALRGRIASYESYLRKLGDMIRESGQRIKDNETAIEQIQNRGRRADFDFLQQFKNKGQQVRAIIARIGDLRSQLADAKTTDSIKSLSDEILDLIKNAQGLSSKSKAIQFQQTYRAVVEETTAKLREQNKIEQDRIDTLKKQSDADAQRLRQIRVLTTEALKFKLVDKQNELLKNDPQAAIAQITGLIDKLDTLIAQTPNIANFDDLVKLRQSLQQDFDEFGNKLDIKKQIVSQITSVYNALQNSNVKFSEDFKARILDIFGPNGVLPENVKDGQRTLETLFEGLKSQFETLSSNRRQAESLAAKAPDTIATAIKQIVAQLPYTLSSEGEFGYEISQAIKQSAKFFAEGNDKSAKDIAELVFKLANQNGIDEEIKQSLIDQATVIQQQFQSIEKLKTATTDLNEFMKTLDKVDGLRSQLITDFAKQSQAQLDNTQAVKDLTAAIYKIPGVLTSAPHQVSYTGTAVPATSLGGITINVTESGNARETARQVAAQLQRDIRRGVIRPLA